MDEITKFIDSHPNDYWTDLVDDMIGDTGGDETHYLAPVIEFISMVIDYKETDLRKEMDNG